MQENSQTAVKTLKGCEIFIKSLEAEGVEYIFGIPGGVILPIYDAFHSDNNPKITHILTKHEQAAVHAAEGYAKSSGKVGVAIVTSGPGATNTVTGITDAYYDSVPIVVFTGNVATSVLGNDAFQESDIVGMTRACTKHNYIVRDVKDFPRIIKEAFYIAQSGRPGPVLVDMPKDVLVNSCEYNYAENLNLPGYNPNPDIDKEAVSRIFDYLEKAEKPVILCGGGVVLSDANSELVSFSEKFDIPVTSTLMGLGGYPGHHKNFLGFSGMHGRYGANLAVANCDLLIILGSKLSDRQTGTVSGYCPNAKVIHIDIDPTSLNKNMKADLPINANVKDVLEFLNEKSKSMSLSDRQKETRAHWWAEINSFVEKGKEFDACQVSEKLRPCEVIKKVYELSNEDAIFVTEVGQHQMWSAQFYDKNNPRSFITSGGLGTMGFGYPAALGAQLANPGRQVITIAGDGSFQMNLQEIATAFVYNLPVKVVIINNGFLGMVRQWQGLMFDKRYSQTRLFSPDYELLSKAYSIAGFRVENRDELETKLKEAFAYDGPAIVDCIVEPEYDVYPWVPVGKSNKDMLMEAK